MKTYLLSPIAGDDWLQTADREIRQARMLGAAATEPVRVTAVHSRSHSAEFSRLAQAHAMEFVAHVKDAEPIATAWKARGLRVSLIVASYNYGHFLREAVDSALSQSYQPDEILLSDDSSTDGSLETIERLQITHPHRFNVNINEKNLGIEKHFNVAVGQTSGDLIVILGADNRFPPHYVESCLEALLTHPDAAIAYTDFALFGARAKSVHDSMDARFAGAQIDTDVYLSHFPQFDKESRAILFGGMNFIHGSSMYRRQAFDDAGGYGTRADGPEDWDLFRRVLDKGWNAIKAPDVYLEYRQHSTEQANMQFSYFWELAKLKEDVQSLSVEVKNLSEEREQLLAFRHRLYANPLFRLAVAARHPVRALRRINKSA